MNQILSVEPPKNKEKKVKQKKQSMGGPIEIIKIVRFFAIFMMVFGICIIGTGSYSMYQNSQVGNSEANPVISVKEASDTQLTIEVTNNTPLSQVTYRWNSGQDVQLAANGKRTVEQTIEIPTGENTLYVHAIDNEGRETNHQRTYTRQGSININFEVDGSNLKVTADSANQLSYMTYRWDEEDEQTIQINSTSTEQLIEIPMGQHTITVSVVDINNNTETKEQEVRGVTKPNVEVTTDGSSNFIVRASDDEGIKRIEFIYNETEKSAIDLDKVYPDVEQRKQFEYNQLPIRDGENRLEVTVYNESGVSNTVRVFVKK